MKLYSAVRSIVLLIMAMIAINGYAQQKEVYIDSIEQLLEYAAMDNVNVTMKSGIYRIDDPSMGSLVILKSYGSNTSTVQREPKDYPITTYLHFSGSNSVYNLDGVIVKLGGRLHTELSTPHLYEMFVSGNNNLIKGLSVEDDNDGEAPATSAIMAHVMGDDNTLDGVKLFISGSDPYGYGHLLGKGSPTGIAKLLKHSSLLISGCDTRLLNCKVVTHAYGHGIVMQGAVNTYIDGCYVEGKMRTTDDMLAETEGVAFESGFKSIYPPGVFEPNRMMALSEDGIRTYPFGNLVNRRTKGVTVINTTVKNMRSGVDLGAHIPPTVIKGCTTIECQEKGYSVGSQAVIMDSRGDAKYGPLLTFQGTSVEDCYIELELMPSESDYKVTRLAEINGKGHYIKLTKYNSQIRESVLPIVFGESFWSDVHTFRYPDSDPSAFSGAYNVTLVNETGMPAEFKALSGDCELFTDGAVLEDLGKNNSIVEIADDVVIYNRGVAGNTTFDLLNRVHSDVTIFRPDLTIIMVGANDMLNSRKVVSYESYEANLTELIEQIKACGSQVMLLSAIPADSKYLFERHDKSKYTAHPDEMMSSASAIVEELALRLDCHFVDLHSEFVTRGLPNHNKDIYIRNQKNSRVKDGVHPTAEGYELIGEIVWNFIDQNNLEASYKKIVCFGDSITKGTGASGAGTTEGENYPSYLNRRFNKL